MSLISDVADYLEDQGLGTVTQDIFDNYLPDVLDAGMCVIDTGGPKQEVHGASKPYTFQVYIRAATYDAAKTKLDQVRDALHQQINVTYGSTEFLFILAETAGGLVYDSRSDSAGKQSRGQVEMSINFSCKIR